MQSDLKTKCLSMVYNTPAYKLWPAWGIHICLSFLITGAPLLIPQYRLYQAQLSKYTQLRKQTAQLENRIQQNTIRSKKQQQYLVNRLPGDIQLAHIIAAIQQVSTDSRVTIKDLQWEDKVKCSNQLAKQMLHFELVGGYYNLMQVLTSLTDHHYTIGFTSTHWEKSNRNLTLVVNAYFYQKIVQEAPHAKS